MGRNDQALDATIQVVTPEHIAFEYRLAGPFRRLPAFVLDFCIQIAIVIGVAILLGFTVAIASPGLAMFLIFVTALVIWWFYGALFETFSNGQTPGKYVFGLRVLSDQGQPINGLQATRAVLERSPKSSVIMVSGVSEPSCRSAASRAGAMAFVSKRAINSELMQVLADVLGERGRGPGNAN
jgi:uncharacterized RDD family membrane protein YckC